LHLAVTGSNINRTIVVLPYRSAILPSPDKTGASWIMAQTLPFPSYRGSGPYTFVSYAHGERFATIRPANTLVAVRLVGDEYLVEVDAEATVPA